MSWQSKVLGLCKKYGSAAKFAATTILGAVVPGSPAVISLVEQAFDAAYKSGQDDWEINTAKQLQTTVDNQARLEQMLDVLGGDLQHVFAQMASLQQLPQLAEQLLAVAKSNDIRWQESAKKLDVIAHRFDRLEDLIRAGHRDTTEKLDEVLTHVRGRHGATKAQTEAYSPPKSMKLGENILTGEWRGTVPAGFFRTLVIDKDRSCEIVRTGDSPTQGTWKLGGHNLFLSVLSTNPAAWGKYYEIHCTIDRIDEQSMDISAYLLDESGGGERSNQTMIRVDG